MKIMTFLIAAVYLGLVAAALSSFAEEKKALSDEAEVAYVKTGGNTQLFKIFNLEF